ncbi:glycosyltransferase family 4 protein [Cognataquiflexum aquatile]|uniref:glycosyltransferase family 4 protein n=1 Tax=Cognataquiflexum aquatile TaxID=2249427 RepID=UPI000DEB6788|nr:glycosyltransferase family 4 protein [Cognataquiflexum aquatile]
MNNKKQKVWIFSEVFYPDQTSTGYILTELAKGLADEFDVTVITESGNSYGVLSKGKDELTGLEVIRFKNYRLDKNSLFQRLIKLTGISVKFLSFFLKNVNKNDKVICVTNPALALLGFSFLNKFKKSKIILIVHDVFPENLVAGGLLKDGFIYRLLKKSFDMAYSSFDFITVLGRDMLSVVRSKIDISRRIEIVENWGQVEELRQIESNKFDSFKDDRISFVFAGNLGRLQNLEVLVNQFGQLKDKITLTLIGEGAVKNELLKIIEEKKYTNIKLFDSQPREEQIHFINSFDVSIISLSEKMYGLGVPSKTYNILACGKPILYIGPKDSEIDILISTHKIGWSLNSFDQLPSVLSSISKDSISKIDRIKIRKLSEDQYTYGHFMEKMKNILQNV